MLKCPYPNIRLCHWQARIRAKNIHQTATWIQWLKWGLGGPRHPCFRHGPATYLPQVQSPLLRKRTMLCVAELGTRETGN